MKCAICKQPIIPGECKRKSFAFDSSDVKATDVHDRCAETRGINFLVQALWAALQAKRAKPVTSPVTLR